VGGKSLDDVTGRDGRVWDGFLVPAAGANVLDDLDPLRLLLFVVFYFCWPCDWTVWGYCEPVRRRWRLVGRMESIGEVGRLCLTITHNGGPGAVQSGVSLRVCLAVFFSCVMLRRRVAFRFTVGFLFYFLGWTNELR